MCPRVTIREGWKIVYTITGTANPTAIADCIVRGDNTPDFYDHETTLKRLNEAIKLTQTKGYHYSKFYNRVLKDFRKSLKNKSN